LLVQSKKRKKGKEVGGLPGDGWEGDRETLVSKKSGQEVIDELVNRTVGGSRGICTIQRLGSEGEEEKRDNTRIG